MKMAIPLGTKAILFDLGGVLLDLHMQKTFDAFAALGFSNFHEYFDSYSGSPFIEDFEEGKITIEEFITIVKRNCKPNTSTNQIFEAWNAMLGELPLHKFEFLKELKQHYALFLYSNTNAIHVNFLHKYYNILFGPNVFQDCFTKIYYSQELGIRKPNKAGFETILHEQNLLPHEVFYIDDGKIHIATAQKLGINCQFWQQNRPFQ